jgi:hypothetical protein
LLLHGFLRISRFISFKVKHRQVLTGFSHNSLCCARARRAA